jgi:hypothetical protein
MLLDRVRSKFLYVSNRNIASFTFDKIGWEDDIKQEAAKYFGNPRLP